MKFSRLWCQRKGICVFILLNIWALEVFLLSEIWSVSGANYRRGSLFGPRSGVSYAIAQRNYRPYDIRQGVVGVWRCEVESISRVVG